MLDRTGYGPISPGEMNRITEGQGRLVADVIRGVLNDLGVMDRPEVPGIVHWHLALVREELSWERVMTPLVEFCRTGRSIASPKRQRIPALFRRTFAHAAITARYLSMYRLSGKQEQAETL